MNIETTNRKAFQLTTESRSDIDLYKRFKEKSQLESARAKLLEARSEDPQYLPAIYYSAMVKDLMGRSEDALRDFEDVLNENPPFVEEVRYHLGLAHYHRYNRPHLESAAEHFNAVIRNTTDPGLRIRARAGLAQTYAMRMVPPDPRNSHLLEVQKYFDLSNKEYEAVIGYLEDLSDGDSGSLDDIRWGVYNGHGMALMYYSDYFGDKNEKVRRLRQAVKLLKTADKYSPQSWANYCDTGSVHMRLGYWLQSQPEFGLALKPLRQVIRVLRPNYGFALYEIGRTYRLMGRFKTAVKYFDRALMLEYAYRDVSDARVNLEKERAIAESKQYP